MKQSFYIRILRMQSYLVQGDAIIGMLCNDDILIHKGEDNNVSTLPTHLINKVLYINLPPTISGEEIAGGYLEEFHGE